MPLNDIWRSNGTLLSPSKLQVKQAVANGEAAPVGTNVIAAGHNYDTQEAVDKRMNELIEQYGLRKQ